MYFFTTYQLISAHMESQISWNVRLEGKDSSRKILLS